MILAIWSTNSKETSAQPLIVIPLLLFTQSTKKGQVTHLKIFVIIQKCESHIVYLEESGHSYINNFFCVFCEQPNPLPATYRSPLIRSHSRRNIFHHAQHIQGRYFGYGLAAFWLCAIEFILISHLQISMEHVWSGLEKRQLAVRSNSNSKHDNLARLINQPMTLGNTIKVYNSFNL